MALRVSPLATSRQPHDDQISLANGHPPAATAPEIEAPEIGNPEIDDPEIDAPEPQVDQTTPITDPTPPVPNGENNKPFVPMVFDDEDNEPTVQAQTEASQGTKPPPRTQEPAPAAKLAKVAQKPVKPDTLESPIARSPPHRMNKRRIRSAAHAAAVQSTPVIHVHNHTSTTISILAMVFAVIAITTSTISIVVVL